MNDDKVIEVLRRMKTRAGADDVTPHVVLERDGKPVAFIQGPTPGSVAARLISELSPGDEMPHFFQSVISLVAPVVEADSASCVCEAYVSAPKEGGPPSNLQEDYTTNPNSAVKPAVIAHCYERPGQHKSIALLYAYGDDGRPIFDKPVVATNGRGAIPSLVEMAFDAAFYDEIIADDGRKLGEVRAALNEDLNEMFASMVAYGIGVALIDTEAARLGIDPNGPVEVMSW